MSKRARTLPEPSELSEDITSSAQVASTSHSEQTALSNQPTVHPIQPAEPEQQSEIPVPNPVLPESNQRISSNEKIGN